MADNETLKTEAKLVRSVDVGVFAITTVLSVLATTADNGQTIAVLDVPHGLRVLDAKMHVSKTLGVGATIKLQHYDTSAASASDITAATAAGAAGLEPMTRAPFDMDAGDQVIILVGGADFSADGVITVDLVAQRL